MRHFGVLALLAVVLLLPQERLHAHALCTGGRGPVLTLATQTFNFSNTEPGSGSTEVRWRRDEIRRKSLSKNALAEKTGDYVALVAVPILLFMALIAVLRLRDF